MLCPSRQTAVDRRRSEVLKQLNKIGGAVQAKRLLREHQLLGSAFQGTTSAQWNNSALQSVLSSNPAFAQTLNTLFPGSYAAGEFIADLSASLGKYTFEPGNAIPMISVCRDEITRPLVDAVEAIWGNSFSLGSIAGMIFAGTTGLSAGMHHAPQLEEPERYIFIVAPHIGISASGVVGQVQRPHIDAPSTACGSLAGFLGEMNKGLVNFALSTTDLEQSMMKGQMSTYFPYGPVPTLQDLTKDAQKLIKAQLLTALSAFNLVDIAEYAIVSGVQIHGPSYSTFFWPTDYYVIGKDGSRVDPGFAGFGQGLGAEFYDKVVPFTF